MNPSLSERVVARAYERDAAAAAAEYGGEFRTDVEAFITREIVDACVDKGCLERPPMPGTRYFAFVDPSGGSSDAMTAAVAHSEGDIVVLDAIRERKAPFNPSEVVAEFAGLFATYRVGVIHGDRYAGAWPAEAFGKHGINYKPAELTRSELYLTLLPGLTSRRARLLDDERLTQQLIGLERRTSRAGRDSIDHAPGAHDDRANAVAGAIVTATSNRLEPLVFHELRI